MGITRAVIGAVAAAGVARLLAPRETDRAVKAVKGAVKNGVESVEHAMKPGRAKVATARVKKAVKSGARKTTKAATKVRKAASRPARKSSR